VDEQKAQLPLRKQISFVLSIYLSAILKIRFRGLVKIDIFSNFYSQKCMHDIAKPAEFVYKTSFNITYVFRIHVQW